MKSMSPAIRPPRVCLALFLLLFAFSSFLAAQTRRSSRNAKPVAKNTEKKAKDARKENKKDSRKERLAAKSKNSKKESAKDRDKREKSARKDRDRDKRDKLARKDRDRDRDSKKDRLTKKEKERLAANERKDPKSKAERKRAEAERRRIEEERRQAALAERRRREEAARQARLRQIAFENGLRTQTAENIANDNTEGEDPQVRSAAVDALGNRAGTVVVMEAQTGKVLTIVNQDWAIKNSFKPCSTIKLVTGVAGLTEHVINEEGGIGRSTSGLTLDTAIARSNNGYFQRVGSNLGSGKMVTYARTLGLGEQTGINADGETAGRVPNGNNNARIYSHGDDFEVTPLQLAVMVSAISNGGKRVVPQVARTRYDNTNFHSRFRKPVGVPGQNLEGVLPGMIGTAEYGTARRGVDSSLGIAGKTGSCIYKGTWIGLFTSIAPVENPKYSVVVITRGSRERGKYAAAIAGRVYQTLSPRIRPSRNIAMADARFKRKVQVDRSNIAVEDEDDQDDSMAEAADSGDISDTVVAPVRQAAVSRPVQKPLVTKIVKSEPKFPQVVITYDKSDPGLRTRPRVVKNK